MSVNKKIQQDILGMKEHELSQSEYAKLSVMSGNLKVPAPAQHL